jgi:hypothetical protein
MKQQSIHSIFIIFVIKNTQHLQRAVAVKHRYGWMRNAIEHVCLNRRIMYHIFKNQPVAYLQRLHEGPVAHESHRSGSCCRRCDK